MSTRRIPIIITVIATFVMVLPLAAAPITEEVIVVLNPTGRHVPEVANEMAQTHGGEVGFIYTTAIQGFTLRVSRAAINGLSANPNVAYVEPVQAVEAAGTQPIPTGVDRIEGDLNPPTAPMNVDIAILDTGVYIGDDGSGARSHLDLNLRWVSDCTGAIFYPLFGGCSGSGDFQDYHGHGTHVAGIAAALDNDIGSVGVAPGATLWSFKVLQADGTGTTGMILAGIDAVASKAAEIEVANMSLGFVGTSQAIDDAISNATDAGVVFVVAAGNDAIDAGQFSPASSPDVITVSALADFDGLPGGLGSATCRPDIDDTLADFSNFGPDVEIAAPGVCIFSTDLNDGYSIKSGTSMASPFVAGAVARYIAETGAPTNNRSDVEAIKAAVIGAGMPQASACGFTDIDSSPEPLLFVNGPAYGGTGLCASGGAPPLNNPPTAGFGWSCTDLDCSFTNTSSDPDVGDTLTYTWDFGDGSGSSTVESPSYSYLAGGTYTVSLTASDGSLSDTATETVTVTAPPIPNNPPTAGFGWSCTDLDCSFTNTSSDPDVGDTLTYTWDFGDGSGSSTVESPSYSYLAGGTYTVSLTASDGSLSDTATETVTVTAPVVSTIVTAGVAPLLVDGRDVSMPLNVIDGDGNYVGGATVEGVWTYTQRGRDKTTTDSTVSLDDVDPTLTIYGNALIANRFPPSATVVSFCLTSISAPGYTYQAPPFACGTPSGVEEAGQAISSTYGARIE